MGGPEGPWVIKWMQEIYLEGRFGCKGSGTCSIGQGTPLDEQVGDGRLAESEGGREDLGQVSE